MPYLLKQYDTPLLCFEMEQDFDGMRVDILSFDTQHAHLLPLEMQADPACSQEQALARWLRHRVIPANRAYVGNFLAKLGLSEKDTAGIIRLCKGLSLNDSYWVVPKDSEERFAQKNLFENPISRTLADIAFTGYGSYNKSTFRSSPEFTTNGMLAKSWRRKGGTVYLYKSGTQGFANSGLEPYSEFYAYQVAKAMGVNAVSYHLEKWKNTLCSTCALFTTKDISFVAAGRLIPQGGIKAVLTYYEKLGDAYAAELRDMLLLDAVICNTDRHLGNFGFLVDNKSNSVIGTAPAFDHGLSLFCYAMPQDLPALEQYAATRTPALYNDFLGFSKAMLTREQKSMLRRLIGFRFQRHSRYNLPPERLAAIERTLASRIALLLE